MKTITFKSTDEYVAEFKVGHPLVKNAEGKWAFRAHQFYFRNRKVAADARAREAYNFAIKAPAIIVG